MCIGKRAMKIKGKMFQDLNLKLMLRAELIDDSTLEEHKACLRAGASILQSGTFTMAERAKKIELISEEIFSLWFTEYVCR